MSVYFYGQLRSWDPPKKDSKKVAGITAWRANFRAKAEDKENGFLKCFWFENVQAHLRFGLFLLPFLFVAQFDNIYDKIISVWTGNYN